MSEMSRQELKDLFMLNKQLIYLNHGSFGACPRPVMRAYQEWQRCIERNPVNFLARELPAHLSGARRALSEHLGCDRDDVVLFPNPTTAINIVARRLDLKPGDEILTKNHEHGAMDRTWQYICDQSEARSRRQVIPLPV